MTKKSFGLTLKLCRAIFFTSHIFHMLAKACERSDPILHIFTCDICVFLKMGLTRKITFFTDFVRTFQCLTFLFHHHRNHHHQQHDHHHHYHHHPRCLMLNFYKKNILRPQSNKNIFILSLCIKSLVYFEPFACFLVPFEL